MKNVILKGDCLEVLKTLADNLADSIVTDPPYELGFMGKSWDNTGIANNVEMWKECLRVLKPGGHLLAFSGTRTYHRMACAIEDAGFEVRDMIEWVYSTGFPKSLNVKKQLEKQYGTKALSKHQLRPVSETNLSQTKSAKKEQGEVLQSGLSEQSLHETMQGEEPKESTQNGKKSSVERRSNLQTTKGELQKCPLCEMSEGIYTDGKERRIHNGTQISNGETPEQIINQNRGSSSHRPQPEQQLNCKLNALCEQHLTQEIRRYDGIGTALKPAHEPICMARKPLSEKTVAENCLKWGTGGINIEESRVPAEPELAKNWDRNAKAGFGNGLLKGGLQTDGFKDNAPTGRFPANLILSADENGQVSDEVKECFPEAKGWSSQKHNNFNPYGGNAFNKSETTRDGFHEGYNDSGNASRFFKSIIYQPKASKSERNMGMDVVEDSNKRPQGEAFGDGSAITEHSERKGNFHPTVKPIALMEYLIKMVTPKGGVVLDPFAGSGSTLVAAKQNGFQYIGIELTEEYIPIIEARLKSVKQSLPL